MAERNRRRTLRALSLSWSRRSANACACGSMGSTWSFADPLMASPRSAISWVPSPATVRMRISRGIPGTRFSSPTLCPSSFRGGKAACPDASGRPASPCRRGPNQVRTKPSRSAGLEAPKPNSFEANIRSYSNNYSSTTECGREQRASRPLDCVREPASRYCPITKSTASEGWILMLGSTTKKDWPCASRPSREVLAGIGRSAVPGVPFQMPVFVK
jgi:hypothetical protein